jgi:hypothetical protein
MRCAARSHAPTSRSRPAAPPSANGIS